MDIPNIPEILSTLVKPGRGFQGFLCEDSGTPVEVLDCLQCAELGAPETCQMTAPVIAGITASLRDDDFGLTVTSLIGCARKARLRQASPYWLKPSSLWWAYRGVLMHDVARIYAGGNPDAIAEQRYSIAVDMPDGQVATVTGQPDLVYRRRRHLIDYKTTRRIPAPWKTYSCPETNLVLWEGSSAWRNKYIRCTYCETGQHEAKEIVTEGARRPYEGHVAQLSLYRLILEENGIPIDTAEIIYLDMSEQLRMPVALMTDEEAYAYLIERLTLHRMPELPPVEASGLCDYCAVSATCAASRMRPIETLLESA